MRVFLAFAICVALTQGTAAGQGTRPPDCYDQHAPARPSLDKLPSAKMCDMGGRTCSPEERTSLINDAIAQGYFKGAGGEAAMSSLCAIGYRHLNIGMFSDEMFQGEAAVKPRHCPRQAHSNAAEMTLHHFTGSNDYSAGHAVIANMVETNPVWRAWEWDHLDCGDGSCECVEK
jgi:hypothetical protein